MQTDLNDMFYLYHKQVSSNYCPDRQMCNMKTSDAQRLTSEKLTLFFYSLLASKIWPKHSHIPTKPSWNFSFVHISFHFTWKGIDYVLIAPSLSSICFSYCSQSEATFHTCVLQCSKRPCSFLASTAWLVKPAQYRRVSSTTRTSGTIRAQGRTASCKHSRNSLYGHPKVNDFVFFLYQ